MRQHGIVYTPWYQQAAHPFGYTIYTYADRYARLYRGTTFSIVHITYYPPSKGRAYKLYVVHGDWAKIYRYRTWKQAQYRVKRLLCDRMRRGQVLDYSKLGIPEIREVVRHA